MSQRIEDGGPAFPITVPVEFQYAYDGMSLRDWFAGQALPAVIAATSAGQHHLQVEPEQTAERALADAAYKLADAMLAARQKGPTA
jgi:hypothetical protein